MNAGGTAILPQEPFVSHADQLLPVRAVAFWGFTDLSDPRWQLGPRFIRLRTDASRPNPQKIQVENRQGCELESLRALGSLAPGDSVDHEERWFLFKDVELPADDESLDRVLAPHLRVTR